jgi:hypothetical protein
MNKFFILSFVVLLAGCTGNNDSFQNKKECASLFGDISMKVESRWGEVDGNGLTPTGMQIIAPQVFYSPILDSCVYKYEVIQSLDNNSGRYYIGVSDFLNNKDIISVVCDSIPTLIDDKYDSPQFTGEDLDKFLDCTAGVDEEINRLQGDK